MIPSGATLADDAGWIVNYWVKDDKLTCVSVTNPNIQEPYYFLFFDYSPKVGEERGKPWTVVEKGTCYEIDEDGGDFYRVFRETKLTPIYRDGKFYSYQENYSMPGKLVNYSLYKPTDDLRFLCSSHTTNCGDSDTIGEQVSDQYYLSESFYSPPPVLSSRNEIINHSFDFIRASLFPTKYSFAVFPGVLDRFGGDEIVTSPTFTELSALESSLTNQMESTIHSCDTRVRVEHQFTYVSTESFPNLIQHTLPYLEEKNIIWKFKDGHTVSFKAGEKTDPFDVIEKIGCKPAFGSFIRSHKTDFDIMDDLTQTLNTKMGNHPVSKQDEKNIAKILAFVASTEPEAIVPVEPIIISPIATATEKIIPTVVDEPTPEKKIEMAVNSPNPWFKFYRALPVLALIGMIIFIIKRRGKNV